MLAGAFATAMSLLCLAWVRHFSDFSLLVQDYISSYETCCMSKIHFPPFPLSKCYENADSEMW